MKHFQTDCLLILPDKNLQSLIVCCHEQLYLDKVRAHFGNEKLCMVVKCRSVEAVMDKMQEALKETGLHLWAEDPSPPSICVTEGKGAEEG